MSYPLFDQLNNLPAHREVRIPKHLMPALPSGCDSTWLGDYKGAEAQYRCNDNVHIREYPDRWVAHRDYVDPRKDFVGHLVKDSPGALSLGTGLATGLIVGLATRDGRKAVEAGVKACLITVVLEVLASLGSKE